MTYSFTHIETESVFELSQDQISQVRETLGIYYDDLDDCDSSIPHLLSDYKVGSII